MQETKNSATFGTLALIISDIAILDALFMMFGANNHEASLNLRFLPWMLLTLLTFILYYTFLRKERTLVQAVIFLGIAYVFTVFIMLGFFAMQPGIVLNLIAVLFFAIPFCRLYFLLEEPPTLDKLISRFGAIIFVLLITFVFLIGTGESLARAVPCIGVLILSLVALVIMRTMNSGADSKSGVKGAFVICTFLILIGCVITLFVLVSFGETLAAGAIAIWSVILYILSSIARFFAWLFSLLEVSELDTTIMGGAPMPGANEMMYYGEIMDFGEVVLVLFLSAIGLAAIALIVWWTIQLRKRKIGGKPSKKAIVIRKSKLGLRLKTDNFMDSLKFIIKGIIYRNTPQGVFLKLERWGKLRRKGRALSETPRKYLMRISDSVPEQREALSKLADALDAIFYDSQKELPKIITPKELSEVRRAFT